jgi:hypothetical protein
MDYLLMRGRNIVSVNVNVGENGGMRYRMMKGRCTFGVSVNISVGRQE